MEESANPALDQQKVQQIVSLHEKTALAWDPRYKLVRKNFNYYGGMQLDSSDKAWLELQKRAPYEFDITSKAINALLGAEINSRVKLKASPVGIEDAEKAGLHTAVLDFFQNKTDLYRKRTILAAHAFIGGMGWCDTTFVKTWDFPEGRPDVEVLDPTKVFPDPFCTSFNFDEGCRYITEHKWLSLESVKGLVGKDKQHLLLEMEKNSIDLPYYKEKSRFQLWADRIKSVVFPYGSDANPNNSTYTWRDNWVKDEEGGLYKVVGYHDKRFDAQKILRHKQTGKIEYIDTEAQKDQQYLDYLLDNNPEFELDEDSIETIWLTYVCPALSPNEPVYERPYKVQGRGYKLKVMCCYAFDPDIRMWRAVADKLIHPQDAYNKFKNVFLDNIVRTVNSGWKIKRGSVPPQDMATWESTLTGQNRIYDGEMPVRDDPPAGTTQMIQLATNEFKQDAQSASTIYDNFVGGEQTSNETGKLFQKRVAQTTNALQPVFNNIQMFDISHGRYFHRLIQLQVRRPTVINITGIVSPKDYQALGAIQKGRDAFIQLNYYDENTRSWLNDLHDGVYNMEVDTDKYTTTAKQRLVEEKTEWLTAVRNDPYLQTLMLMDMFNLSDMPDKDKYVQALEEYMQIKRKQLIASGLQAEMAIQDTTMAMQQRLQGIMNPQLQQQGV